MLKRIIEIARLYLVTTYRGRAMIIFGIVLPIIFTWVIGSAIGGYEPEDRVPVWQVRVVMQDTGTFGPRLVDRLDADPILEVSESDAATAHADVESEAVDAALIIPPDFSERVLAAESFDLQFEMNLGDPVDAQVVQQAVLAALGEVQSWLIVGETSVTIADQLGLFTYSAAPDQQTYFEDALTNAQAELAENPPVMVHAYQSVRDEASEIKIPNGQQQTSPGMMVIFVLFSVFGGTASLLLERERGTLRRLMVMPMGKFTIMAGKVLGIFFAGAIQIYILIFAGQLLFQINWGRDMAALTAMVLSYAFASTALGILVAALVRSYDQLNALGTAIIIPISGLGGAMWPIEIVPPFMQKLALFFPTGWAMRGFHDIITRGLGLQDVLLEAGVLVAFGVVFLAIGIWRFRYE